MPEVSIVLPTYNRADTLPRAIASVRRQSFQDWELLLVDDGSTDDTARIAECGDPRVRYIPQRNRGCYAARNTGLRQASGRLLAFLDSDDEWFPHFLELTTAFLRASPGEQYVMTEFLSERRWRSPVRCDLDVIAEQRVRQARVVGSRMLDLTGGETDEYLRIYQTRELIGPWGSEIAERIGQPRAHLYRGHIAEHYRWGYLGWLPTTVLTRAALERVGLFPESYRSSADYRFLVLLSRHYRANMIAIPSAIKHELHEDGTSFAEGHLATGASEYRFALNRLTLFDELFVDSRRPDTEISRIRGLLQGYAGDIALRMNLRAEAMEHFASALSLFPEAGPSSWTLLLLQLIPSGRLAGGLYRFAQRCAGIARNLAGGRITAEMLWRRLLPRLARRQNNATLTSAGPSDKSS